MAWKLSRTGDLVPGPGSFILSLMNATNEAQRKAIESKFFGLEMVWQRMTHRELCALVDAEMKLKPGTTLVVISNARNTK